MRQPPRRIDVLIARLLDLLLPSRCPVCAGPSDHWRTAPLCRACWEEIPRHDGKGCRVCAAVTAYDPGDNCQECRALDPRFDRVIAFGVYEGALKEAVHHIKFLRIKRLALALGRELAALDLPPADCVIPVPLSRDGLRSREFNQAALMARVLAKSKGLPLHLDILLKIRETLPQATLPMNGRRENVKGAFGLGRNVQGLRVILVDDVVTTGATVNECARVLKKGGAISVTVMAAARAR